ncbi:acyl-CoA-binding domain-containing protein 3-like isoform X1 [Cynara cardunculus var. scolymus]|uniref:acyl-CoA-binding domain-containing protein 3-like isoform X1 n=1 Tax=Cynara cardunculus var. scolymus TaxID=59895 RepID=UPI000D62DF62|nr:acyl-CoA-binding domain-containing protein 3-like isoform X1 [Cynara cardunculus var. scolymus]
MELFQELVFTISLSLIVSLLVVKLFSMASGGDDGNSTVSKRVEEKIEKEWVVCDSEKEEKAGYFEDAVEVSKDVVCGGYVEAELGSGCVMEDTKSVGEVGASYVFDESPERTDFKDASVGLVKSGEVNVSGSSIQEDCMKSIVLQQESIAVDGGDDGGEVKIEEGDGILYDDWQGIETTELEKDFGAAVAFMGSKISADRVSLIDNEVKLQFYGLHKVALEGPCFESQPMALKISARDNWNAWKRLENLGRDEAMAQYIALLSRHVPDWMGNHASEDDMQDFIATRISGKLHSDEETPIGAESERTLEQMNPCIDLMAVEGSTIIIGLVHLVICERKFTSSNAQSKVV